ncbi:tyrosine-type recombinase/integrase [uncultured Campylobacter sp.]|uniref:tyrosine-type recombinase/integrase n=1 Tax=uncultured Campylobacter sp. TaxID=218934 RepID=UPI00262CBE5B|nr:tyrosine-type recombinase/integrase [uncultured Campylobacter sp.]
MKVFSKIKDDPAFKTDPDKVIRNFSLPHRKNTMVEMIDEHIAVRFYRSFTKKGIQTIHRHYHYSIGGKLIKSLGNADEISLSKAKETLEGLIVDGSTKLAAPSNTLASVYRQFCRHNGNVALATSKRRDMSFKALRDICDKDINKISKKDIMPILDYYYDNEKYASLEILFKLIKRLFRYARIRDISKNPLFAEEVFKDFYNIPRHSEYPYIKDDLDLTVLIKFIMNYPHQRGVKNALIFGLLTGLRSSNVRNLTHEHLKIGDDGEYYLLFPQDENKVKSNGDEHLGLPKEVGEWLESIKTKSSLFFANTEGNVLSEATLVKALRQYTPLVGNNGIVFHSFRIILSTFCNDNLVDNGLIPDIIERTIFHRVRGVAGVYNKATNIKNTRRVLTWWLGYLKGLGFKF